MIDAPASGPAVAEADGPLRPARSGQPSASASIWMARGAIGEDAELYRTVEPSRSRSVPPRSRPGRRDSCRCAAWDTARGAPLLLIVSAFAPVEDADDAAPSAPLRRRERRSSRMRKKPRGSISGADLVCASDRCRTPMTPGAGLFRALRSLSSGGCSRITLAPLAVSSHACAGRALGVTLTLSLVPMSRTDRPRSSATAKERLPAATGAARSSPRRLLPVLRGPLACDGRARRLPGDCAHCRPSSTRATGASRATRGGRAERVYSALVETSFHTQMRDGRNARRKIRPVRRHRSGPIVRISYDAADVAAPYLNPTTAASRGAARAWAVGRDGRRVRSRRFGWTCTCPTSSPAARRCGGVQKTRMRRLFQRFSGGGQGWAIRSST